LSPGSGCASFDDEVVRLDRLAVGGADLGASGDFDGLVVGAPSTTLIFGPMGLPEAVATYTFTVDHPELPGDKKIIVTGGGEIRVQ
jgi:hypothetical protein